MGASNDDVDRLFACFKCGISPPRSAVRERPPRQGKKLRVASAAVSDGGGSNSASASASSTREADEKSSEHKEPSSAAIKFRNRKQMSPIVFYGSPQGVPVKKPMSLLRLLREIHIDLKKQTDLISRDVVWATFPRQDEAIRFSKEHTHTKVFSYQDHLSGQRRFLVSTYEEFWRRYNTMDPQIRHHYEVIQEGSPCHIYFDLEFNAKFNQKRDADEMVDILVAVTFSALHDKYSIEGQEEWIIELDSSNEGVNMFHALRHAFFHCKLLILQVELQEVERCESREKRPFIEYYLKVLAPKFSRHLIIRIPKTAFKDNSHVGAFVSEVCSWIAAQRAANPNLDKLYITKDSSCAEPVDQLFVDTAVYSRNCCFRLAFSSKSGKKSFLMATGRFKCKNMSDKELFMESLICRLDDDCDKLLICKLDLECKKILHFQSEASVPRIQGRNCPDAIDTYRSNFPQEYTYGRSPFPALDGFIESIASFGSASGKIRWWYWFSQYGLIAYSMSRSRYCEHIGREHKSNHVMYIVDCQRAAYYQKCYDPDCQGYRSPLRAVPWDVIPELSSTANSAQQDYQGKVVEINIEGTDRSEFLPDGNSVMESGKEDLSWWEEAVKFADSVESADHAPAFCNLEDDSCDDADWWMHAERLMVQMESQGDA